MVRWAGWVSIIGNVFLFALKMWAGIVSSSVAIMADAWHTMSDSLTSVIVLVSNVIVRKPADSKHPFGHGRAEPIAATIIGVLLSVVAFDFIMESIRSLREHEPGQFGLVAIIVTIISIVSKEAMAQYSFHIARQSGSGVVKADGWHHRSDAFSSLVILIGIIFARYAWWIDAALGFAVAILILYTAFTIMKTTVSNLLGERADPEMIRAVKELSTLVAGRDLGPHHFHAHSYGDHTELTFHICLPGNMTIDEAHEVTDLIEKKIADEMNLEATIHIDPL